MIGTVALATHQRSHRSSALFAPTFAAGPARLVTNEFATYNPGADARRSADWLVTSGSLFARDGAGWSGIPDSGNPDAGSANATGSSVFRLVSRRTGLGDVSIRLRFKIESLLAPSSTTHAWDGLHVFARYQSQTKLYVVSISRRDGSVVAKKKLPGGPSNGGTYVQLGSTARVPTTHGVWHDVQIDVRNEDHGVRLKLQLDGRAALDVLDQGLGGPPLTQPGRVGIRADNAEFDFDEFSVRGL